jgi:hypothetical protein
LRGGQWNVKEKPFSHFPTFPPINLFKPSFFSYDLEVLLYHGPRSLLTPFLHFPRSINYECAYRHTKFFTPSLSIKFCLKIWFFSSPWNHGVAHGHILRAPSRSNERRTAFGIISRSDPNVISLWWKTQTLISARSSWSWTPSSLVLLYFFELSHFGDLVIGRLCFWWRTWNHLWRFLRN